MDKIETSNPELMEENVVAGGEEQVLDISSDLIRGHINTIILRCLFDEDKYGYDIMDDIERKSGGLYKLKPPTLYSALKRLESLGHVQSYAGEFSNGGRRKYFRLTDEGRTIARRNLSEWQFSRTIIDSLISDGDGHFDFSFITEKQQELEELKRSLAAREAALTEEKENLENFRNELQRERALLNTQKETLSTKKNDINENSDKVEAEREELEQKRLALSEREGELEAKAALLAAQEAEFNAAAETIEQLERELRETAELLERSQQLVIAQAEELRDTESALSALQKEYSAIKTELAALRESMENTQQTGQALALIPWLLFPKRLATCPSFCTAVRVFLPI